MNRREFLTALGLSALPGTSILDVTGLDEVIRYPNFDPSKQYIRMIRVVDFIDAPSCAKLKTN